MQAAIYARRSTEQRVAEEAKSVTRQIENARAFALSRGWAVRDEHVFVDDGVSGAEFEKRPGFMRMMGSLRPRAPFGFLVVSEQKSIGREMSETAYAIKQLAEAGVEVFEYGAGRSLTPKNATEKVLSSVHGYADEAHREQTAKRMHEAHSRLARAGHVTGGRLFGYRNRHVTKGADRDGNPLHSHVERVVEDQEAAVVLRIFQLYASGLGLKAIARTLNLEGAIAPRYSPPAGGLPALGGWSPSTVRSILAREIYHGVAVWNLSRKRNDWGKVDQSPRPKEDRIAARREDLRIVPEPLWLQVAARRADVEGRAVRFEGGRLLGRPPKHATKNLLAGLATCGSCGGGMIVETSDGKYARYACSRRRQNGSCTNKLRVPVEEANEAVMRAVEQHVFTPEAIEKVVRLAETEDARSQQSG